MVRKLRTEETISRVLLLKRNKNKLLDEFHRLGDRIHRLNQHRIRYCAAGITVMGTPGPIRDLDREWDLYARIDAKSRQLSEERKRAIAEVRLIEAELEELPHVPIEENEEFD
ncbi:hypothetical protein [Rhizobium sp. RCC_161_2]|uniref:hypothetical protein n=1 Tax=Rhizobium sp. RCC_161_2 TaxID=3239219 RepID=UPI003525B87D